MANKDPVLKINKKKVDYEPNSLWYQKGNSTRKYFPTTGGDVIQTEDLSEAIGKVGFKLRTIDKSEKLFNEFIDLGSLNVITINTGDLNKIYDGMSISNSNEKIERGSDSTFPVEFGGDPASE